ncbi:hypothetical protein DW1_1129 [Proteiniborus sp. DW1]|uniref:TFIIB-type zinc finger domain-containing protein n=1 Tax=Proteiniborus sp. DW1 TaxID=1889883 RepID=UPI00092DFACB|nr:TFIIB-type zinc finger domain-containing protein [Proteiniborus sp. DW1]SCG82702.1 hypothetical protein DW1_1129 [Proteiniborus sp. DW1]
MSVKFYDIKCDKCGSIEWDSKEGNYYCRHCRDVMSDEKISRELKEAFRKHKQEIIDNVSFEVNGMRAFRVDEYYTVVAHGGEEALSCYVEEYGITPDDELYEGVEEINPEKSRMFYPVSEIPVTRLEELIELGHKQEIWDGDLCISITKAEAMKLRNETKPYILSVSSDVL